MGIERKKLILWDMDGVLANTGKEVVGLVRMRLRGLGYATEFGYNDLTSWNAILEYVFNLTGNHDLAEECQNFFYKPETVAAAPAHWGMPTVIKWLNQMGYLQGIVSGRPADNYVATVGWLNSKGLEFLTRDLTLTTREEKVSLIMARNPDWQFDDDFRVVRGLRANPDTIKASRLVLQPWNEEERRQFPPNICQRNAIDIFAGIIGDEIRSRAVCRR